MAFRNHPGRGLQRLFQFLDVPVDALPALILGWQDWGAYTGVAFMVVNKSDASVVATPEMSPDEVHVATVGAGVAVALTVPAGSCSYDPYGVDILAPFWRFWLSGSGSGTVDIYIFAVRRF